MVGDDGDVKIVVVPEEGVCRSIFFFFLQMKRERKKTVCPRVRPALEAQPDSTPPFSTYVQLYIRTRVQVGRSLCPCFFLAKRNV